MLYDRCHGQSNPLTSPQSLPVCFKSSAKTPSVRAYGCANIWMDDDAIDKIEREGRLQFKCNKLSGLIDLSRVILNLDRERMFYLRVPKKLDLVKERDLSGICLRIILYCYEY